MQMRWILNIYHWLAQAKVKLSYSMECSFNCGRFGGIRLRIRTPPVYASAIASHGVTFCFISLKLNEKKTNKPLILWWVTVHSIHRQLKAKSWKGLVDVTKVQYSNPHLKECQSRSVTYLLWHLSTTHVSVSLHRCATYYLKLIEILYL